MVIMVMDVKIKKPAWFLVKCHTWNDIDEVIAVAGGGGGGSQDAKNLNGQKYAWAGSIDGSADRGRKRSNGEMYDDVKAANNKNNIGYAHGVGQFNTNSSGSGGGWYGGYSSYVSSHRSEYQTHGSNCGDTGLGGTSYVNPNNTQITDSVSYAGNDYRLNPVSGTLKKPSAYDIGVNGYITVEKN